MRLPANENIPGASITLLRKAGHDVAAVAEGSAGISDERVLALAAAESRVVLTFDRDYGELIYRIGLPTSAGVVYFRFRQPSPTEPAERLLDLVDIHEIELEGKFTVLTRSVMRQRPLPPTP